MCDKAPLNKTSQYIRRGGDRKYKVYVVALAIVAMMVLPTVIVTDGMSGYATAESECGSATFETDGSTDETNSIGVGNQSLTGFGDREIYNFIYGNGKYRIISSNEVSFEGPCRIGAGVLDLDIPEVVRFDGREYRVTEVGREIIPNSASTVEMHIIIPKTVEVIGKGAITGLQNGNCTLMFSEPSSLETICDGAFMDCPGLTFSAVPSSVKYIGKDAFNESNASGPIVIPDCTEFEPTSFNQETELVIGNGNPYYWVDGTDGAIYSKDGTELIRCPNPDSEKPFQIKNTVKSIGDYAFYRDSNINSISFQEGSILESIGNMAFYESGISSVKIPASVVHIGGCEYPSYDFFDITDNSNFHLENNILYSESGVLVQAYDPSYEMPSGVTITEVGPYAFYYSGITSFDFTSIERIGEYAFYGTELASVTIPACTEYIGEYAFCMCSSLNSLIFADGNELLTRIEDRVFDRCDITSTVKIPNNVEYIGEYAFNLCEISDLVLGPKVSDICMMAFSSITDSEIDIPVSLTNIHGAAFASGAKYNVDAGNKAYASDGNGVLYGIDGNGTKVSIVRVPNGLNAFRVLDTVKTIGMYSFYWNDVAAVEFGDNSSLRTIGYSAFFSAANLKSIDLPASLEEIGSFAFYQSSLSNIIFPVNGNLKVILNGAFSMIDSDDDVSITIPGYVKQIGIEAFSYYKNLSEFTVEYGVELFYTNITGCKELKNFTIPSSVGTLTQIVMQPSGDEALENITIGSGVKINNRTFMGIVFKDTDGNVINDPDKIPGHSYTRDKSEEDEVVMIMNGTLVEVRCDLNDGTGGVTGQDVMMKNGKGKMTLPSLAREGFIHLGWSKNQKATEADHSPGQEIEVEEGKEYRFYAVWRENQFTVSYDANGGSVPAPPERTDVRYGEVITIEGYRGVKDGYAFAGWMLNDVYEVMPGDKITIVEDTNLVAIWEPVPIPEPEHEEKNNQNIMFIAGTIAVVLALFALAFVIVRSRK